MITMKQRKAYIVLLFLLSISISLGACGASDSSKVSGHLKNMQSQEPVTDTALRLVTYIGSNAEGKPEWDFGINDPCAITDSSGGFIFKKVPTGEYSLNVTDTCDAFASNLVADGQGKVIIFSVIAGQSTDLGEILVSR